MTLDHPVWTFVPTWNGGILERLTWLTDVLSSQSGAEQRRAMRLSPRREFEGQFYLTGRERQAFDIGTFMAGGVDWYIPIWHEVVHLAGVLNAGALALPIPDTDREFRAGDYVLLRGKDSFAYEVVQLLSTNDSDLKLISPTEQTWGIGTRVYPLRLGRLIEQPQVVKHTDTFMELHAGFRVMEHNDFPANPTLDTYAGFPVLTKRPNETEDLTHQYVRLMAELDGALGKVNSTDLAGRGFTTQQYRWALYGRPANAEFRRFLYAMRGRWKTFWLPTFMSDLVPTRSVSADTHLYVQNVGRATYAPTDDQDIRIEMTNGTLVYRKILSVAPVSADEEQLTLDSAVTLTPDTVKSISYLNLSRFDVDVIELQHETDADGLTICAMTTRTAPAIRSAVSWEPPAILDFTGSPNGCLPPCAPPSFALDNDLYTTDNDYNPMVPEVWVNSYDFTGGVGRIANRYNAATMEHIGGVFVDPTLITGTLTDVGGAPERCWFWDTARGCVWTVRQLKIGLTFKSFILKIDAETGEILKCVEPTGAGIIGNYYRWVLNVSPNGDIWLLCASSSLDTKLNLLDETTLMPVATYSHAGFHVWDIGGVQALHIVNDAAGNFHMLADDPGGGQEVWKFNVTTHAFSVIWTGAPLGDYPVGLCVDTTRNRIMVGLQIDRIFQVYDPTTGALFADLNDHPAYQIYDNSDARLAYDATNDVLWGMTNWINDGMGRLTGIHVGTNTFYGWYDARAETAPDGVAEIFYGITVPRPGSPNAIYVAGDILPDWDFGYWKIPICNVNRGTPPDPV